jgi:hypothetical protein
MSKKQSDSSKPARGEKSQAIRDALRSYPSMGNKDIAEMLTNKGIKCSSQDVANQKARLKRAGGLGGKGELTLEDLMKVKNLVQQQGGLKQVQNNLRSVDEMADQVGGLDKLRRGLEVLPELMLNG